MSSIKMLAVSLVFIWIFMFMMTMHIMTLYKENKKLNKQIKDVKEELEEIKKHILAPTIPPAGFVAGDYTQAPGFVVQDVSVQTPPPVFGMPPVDPNQFKATGQTSPFDNLPLRGTAK